VPQKARWARVKCTFPTTLATGNNKELHVLASNPGGYEIKVLRDRRLARSLKFSVGAGGKIVNNGVAAASKLLTSRALVPVTVLGDHDG
jgi:hypothetical protein